MERERGQYSTITHNVNISLKHDDEFRISRTQKYISKAGKKGDPLGTINKEGGCTHTLTRRTTRSSKLSVYPTQPDPSPQAALLSTTSHTQLALSLSLPPPHSRRSLVLFACLSTYLYNSIIHCNTVNEYTSH